MYKVWWFHQLSYHSSGYRWVG